MPPHPELRARCPGGLDGPVHLIAGEGTAQAVIPTPASTTGLTPVPPTDGRFLSEAECAALAKRVAGLAKGGGVTQTILESTWTGNIRWARNQLSTCGDVRQTDVQLVRDIRGADPVARVRFNMTDAAALEAGVRRAERLLRSWPETQASATDVEYTERYLRPTIWSEATYGLAAEARAEVVATLVGTAARAGLLAAGYLQVAAHGRAIMSSRGRAMYYPFTEAQYSVTVRDPQGTGSGWAGLSHYDWGKVDAAALTQTAIEKCLQSRNPVAVEPGRYTTILEPQSVCDLGGYFFIGPDGPLGRENNEGPQGGDVFWKAPGQSRLGEVVMDPRLRVRTDPMDPELAHVPFQWGNEAPVVFSPAEWVRDGVLMNLAYDRRYAVRFLGKNTGLSTLGAYKLESRDVPTPIEEMVATTKRGLIVTRFQMLEPAAAGIGYTRDGLWLIENGKISKPVKNFKFAEDFFACLQASRLEQIGVPVRTFSPGVPTVVPALKIKDFNFTQLVDAI